MTSVAGSRSDEPECVEDIAFGAAACPRYGCTRGWLSGFALGVRDERSLPTEMRSSTGRMSSRRSPSGPNLISSTSPTSDTLAGVTYVLPLRRTTMPDDDQTSRVTFNTSQRWSRLSWRMAPHLRCSQPTEPSGIRPSGRFPDLVLPERQSGWRCRRSLCGKQRLTDHRRRRRALRPTLADCSGRPACEA